MSYGGGYNRNSNYGYNNAGGNQYQNASRGYQQQQQNRGGYQQQSYQRGGQQQNSYNQHSSYRQQQQNSAPQSNRRQTVGTVTKIHDKFCFIDNDIFCQLSLFRSAPRIGDRFHVEAEYNPQMPFKWNAIRVAPYVQPKQSSAPVRDSGRRDSRPSNRGDSHRSDGRREDRKRDSRDSRGGSDRRDDRRSHAKV